MALPLLEAMILMNQADLSLCKTINPQGQNLSLEERKAITELTSNSEIIIKPADKGSTVVVLNTTDYIKEAHRQLSVCQVLRESS